MPRTLYGAMRTWSRTHHSDTGNTFTEKPNNTTHMKTILTAGALLLLAFAVSGCGENSDSTTWNSGQTPTTVLKRQSVNVPQSYVADIHGVQFVEVKPKAGGFIEAIYIDEGQKVSKGDTLFQISATEYSGTVKEAEASMKQAEAEYQMAQYEVSRISRLVEKDIISSIRLEKANTELEVAKLKVEQAKAHLQKAQLNYSYTTITAPYDGIVDRIPYKTGSLVNTESLLTTISDVSEVFAYYRMNESEYIKFMRAQLSGLETARTDSIRLYLSDGSVYEHLGKVETVEGDFERGTGSIAFRARFPNPDGLLKHGVSGKISMTTPMEDVCLIPQQSTFEIQEFTYVYTVDSDNVARVRSFEPLGRINGFYITNDLNDNTRIVYSGIQGVKDGKKIECKDVPFEEIMESMNGKTSR